MNNDSISVRLRNIAFQRRLEDYQEVIELLSQLQEQEREIKGRGLKGVDYEAIAIAQAYLREVPNPKKPSQSQ